MALERGEVQRRLDVCGVRDDEEALLEGCSEEGDIVFFRAVVGCREAARVVARSGDEAVERQAKEAVVEGVVCALKADVGGEGEIRGDLVEELVGEGEERHCCALCGDGFAVGPRGRRGKGRKSGLLCKLAG